MTIVLSPLGVGWQFFGGNTADSSPNTPLAGGLLNVYQAGSTTPVTTYTSASGTTPNTNPIVLDSAGRVPYEIWWTGGYSYKLVLTDANGNQIPNGVWDNVQGINDITYTGNLTTATNLLGGAPGDIVYQSYANTTSFLAPGTPGQVLQTNGSVAPTWANPTGGTVTSSSVVTTNGFAGTVANPTTTPAITLETTVSGILYGNGTGVAAAVAGNFPTLNQSTTGNAATATNMAGGSAGEISYQTGSNATSFLAPGTSGYFLQSNGTSAPSWVQAAATSVSYTPPGTGAVATTVAAFLGAFHQYPSGAFFQNGGAFINRMLDRTFMGGFTVADGNFPPVTNDWLSAYLDSEGYTDAAPLGTLNVSTLVGSGPQSTVAMIVAAQSLYAPSSGASTIATSSYAINNHPSLNTNAWAYYGEAHRTVSTTNQVIGMELDTRNTVGAPSLPTPFAQGLVVALQLAAGAGVSSGGYDSNAAIQIVPNPYKFAAGIVFNSTSLTSTGGVMYAISMATNQYLSWYVSAGMVNSITSNTTLVANKTSLLFSDSGASILDASGNNIFQVVGSTTAIANFVYAQGSASGAGTAVLGVSGTDTNINLKFVPKGTGGVQFGTYATGTFSQTGYITILDSGGSARRLMVG